MVATPSPSAAPEAPTHNRSPVCQNKTRKHTAPVSSGAATPSGMPLLPYRNSIGFSATSSAKVQPSGLDSPSLRAVVNSSADVAPADAAVVSDAATPLATIPGHSGYSSVQSTLHKVGRGGHTKP